MDNETFTVINEFLFTHGVRLTCQQGEWRFHTFTDFHDTLTYKDGHVGYDNYADALRYALKLASTLPNRFDLKLREQTEGYTKDRKARPEPDIRKRQCGMMTEVRFELTKTKDDELEIIDRDNDSRVILSLPDLPAYHWQVEGIYKLLCELSVEKRAIS